MKGKKTGGRVAGTPNKATKAVKEWIASILTEYTNSDQFAEDFASLEPKERLTIAEKLMSYTVPKLQATALDVNASKAKTIKDTLKALSQPEEESDE